MAASAYCEMSAYSELLTRIPNAIPDRLSPSVVAEIRKQLLKAWGEFVAERKFLSYLNVSGCWHRG
jgi:hypothetical protein